MIDALLVVVLAVVSVPSVVCELVGEIESMHFIPVRHCVKLCNLKRQRHFHCS